MEISKLYDLIINSDNHQQTFINNLELWKEFYQERKLIIKNNLTDERLYKVIDFLLKNERGEISKHFHSDILDSLNFEEVTLMSKLGNSKSRTSSNSIDTVLTVYSFHNNFSQSLNNYILPSDDKTKSSIDKYQSDNLKLDATVALIMLIYENFFDFNPKIIERAINYIEKESKSLLKETENNTSRINFLYQYIEKFIPLLRYIGNDISENEVIKKILNGEIKNKKIIEKFILSIEDEEYFKILFNNNFINFIDFLEKLNFLDEDSKKNLIDKIITQFLINCKIESHNYFKVKKS